MHRSLSKVKKGLDSSRTAARLALAREALERARALDPDLPELHLAAGEFFYRSSLDHANALASWPSSPP